MCKATPAQISWVQYSALVFQIAVTIFAYAANSHSSMSRLTNAWEWGPHGLFHATVAGALDWL